MLTKVAVLVGAILLAAVGRVDAEVTLQSPQVEYRTTPLGIDVAQPRFSWHMTADAGERAVAQTAYRLEVRDPAGAVAWDSGRREDGRSLGIALRGDAAAPFDAIHVDRDRLDSATAARCRRRRGSRPA